MKQGLFTFESNEERIEHGRQCREMIVDGYVLTVIKTKSLHERRMLMRVCPKNIKEEVAARVQVEWEKSSERNQNRRR